MQPADNQIIATLFLIAPQFQTVDPLILANYAALIAVLRCQVSSRVVECCGALAFALLLAAYLSLQNNPNLGVAGSMTEGQLSIGFNVGNNTDFLYLSPYGRAYMDLIKRTVFAGFVTNIPVNLGGVVTNGIPQCGCGRLGSWPWAVA